MIINLSLKNFNPITAYPSSDSMPSLTAKKKERQRDLMLVLLTEMVIGAASQTELSRAVRHSMVIMSGEKNNLNYVQSAIDNNITGLVEKYVNTTQKVIVSITE